MVVRRGNSSCVPNGDTGRLSAGSGTKFRRLEIGTRWTEKEVTKVDPADKPELEERLRFFQSTDMAAEASP